MPGVPPWLKGLVIGASHYIQPSEGGCPLALADMAEVGPQFSAMFGCLARYYLKVFGLN